MTKKKTRFLLLSVLSATILCGALLAIASRYGHLSVTLPIKHKAEFVPANMALFPPQLLVRGNEIVDESGKGWVLKGVMPPDAAVLGRKRKFNRAFFEEIRSTQAQVIRIPVHPDRWVRDEDYLWRYLDPVVGWAGELNQYVIIDWHYIGNVATGAGPQMPDIDAAPKELTLEFWRLTARYFRDAPNVIFEIFNEPQSITAEEWHRSAEEIIRVIREQGATQLIIVGGIDYGRDLSWVLENPVAGENIVYASHIYPGHTRGGWEKWFGAVAGKYPVMVTEWGFQAGSKGPSTSYLVGTSASYGEPFLNYLEARSIGWVACWYDDEWMPPMFAEGWESYTSFGDFVIQELQK